MNTKLKHIGLKGSGYFCDVIQYRNEERNIDYALKVLKKKHYPDDGYRYRLLREIKLLENLKDCEFIIDLIKSGNDKENEKLWYLMPFAPDNLYKYIKTNNGKIDIKERFNIADQIITAIKYAHSKGIIHRDISPNNVLVFNNPEGISIKVSDFGLGKDEKSLSFYTGSSASGYGQILYVSPEQREQLKSATPASDIYSLGKLIYFIFTGKDPDNMKSFELSSLVSKSIEENPQDRFKNIEDFENYYLALKQLLFDDKIPVEYLTMKEIATSKNDIDWHHFHQLAVKGNYLDHVYYDYIEPTITILNRNNKIEDYYKEIGSDFISFILTFSERIDDCLGTLRWPFSATSDFGDFLKNIVIKVENPEVRLICFKQLWNLAYVSDQWAVQSSIKSILNNEFIDDKIQLSFAKHIQDKSVKIDMSNFTGINIPKLIKVGIIKSNEAYLKAEKERQKEDFDEWNF